MSFNFVKLFFLLLCVVHSSHLLSDSKILRIGGDYKVERIQKRDDGLFEISFSAEKISGKYDHLRLISEHVHIGVKEGATLRISAEVSGDRAGVAEVDQVLIFVPSSQGSKMPVWLLSHKGRGLELKGAKYLEMHNPLSDFSVF